MSMASTNLKIEAVTPTSLRIALSNLYPDSNFFQEAQRNDASEVLGVIFDCLHRSFTSGFDVSDTESVESNGTGSWNCVDNPCVAHSLFGMNIFESLNCYNCGMESKNMKYTSFFHNINASALRMMKRLEVVESFTINIIFSRLLLMFSQQSWVGRTHVSVDDIRATLVSLATEIEIGVLYCGLDPTNRHCLISVVCYYGQHYHCFAYSRVRERWVMYDDKTVKVIGGWDDVITMCERGHLQPQVLFFKAVN